MRIFAALVLLANTAWGQYIPTGSRAPASGGGGGALTFVRICSNDDASGTTAGSITCTMNNTSGDHLLVVASMQTGGTCVLQSAISDASGNSYQAVPPSSSNPGQAMAAAITAGGSGYTTAPTVSTSGGGFSLQPTITGTESGGAITALSVSNAGTGGNGLPLAVVTITPVGGGSGATGVISTMAWGATFACTMTWFAPTVTTATGNVITVSFNGGVTAEPYRAIEVFEISGGTGAIEALGTGAGSTTSPATGTTLTTTHAASFVGCAHRGESVSNSWSVGNIAGSAATKPAGADTPGTLMSAEYRILSSTITSQAGNMVLGSAPADTTSVCVSVY